MSAVKEQYSDDHPFTKLIPDLQNRNPEDAYSSVPYEKVHFIELKYQNMANSFKLVEMEVWILRLHQLGCVDFIFPTFWIIFIFIFFILSAFRDRLFSWFLSNNLE